VAAAAPCVTLPRRGLSAIPSAAAAEPAEVAGSASPPASGTVNAPATQAPDEPRDLAAIVPREATAEGADGSTAGSTAAVGEGGDGRRASQGILQARKEGRYSAVIELFEALTASGEASDARVLDAYVEAIAVTRSVAEAEEVCSAALAQREGMGRTAATYAALLKGCGADKGAALQLLGKMKEEGLAADLGVYHELVSVFTAARDFAAAEETLATMRHGGVAPTTATYYRIINGAFRHDEAAVAYQVLCRMVEEWRTPDQRAYDRMLQHFVRLDHAEGQLRCLEGSLELQGGADAGRKIGYLLRQELERQEQPSLPKVAALWALAERRGVELHRRQMTGVLYALMQLDRHVDAFRAALRALQQGGELSPRIGELLSTGLSRDPSHVDDAYYELEEEAKRGGAVPLKAANLVVLSCARIPDLDRAFATWAELPKLGLSPDIETYNALLSTCVRAREFSSARRLLNRMEAEGVGHNATTYEHRVALHMMSGEPQGAFVVYRECKDAELAPPQGMYHALINHHLRRKPRPNAAAAAELLEEMKADHTRVNMNLQRNVADAVAAVAEDREFVFGNRRGPQEGARGPASNLARA